MKPEAKIFCEPTLWNGRKGYSLGNDVVHLTTLTGGGHIAELQLQNSDGSRSLSPLWVPPWKTIEPHQYREQRHKHQYGPITEGKLLSGIVGHNICLDYFGSPSVEEAALGMSQHGEAPWSKWRKSKLSRAQGEIALEMSVRLPVAGLQFTREIALRKGESLVYFKETVRNQRRSDHFFHWTQHITLGPEFLAGEDSSIAIPGTRAITYPHGNDEDRALLASNQEFTWPDAPLREGGEVDLTRPFPAKGRGFVVAVLLDKSRNLGFVAAVNRKLGLLIAYCFERSDFPWVAVWEENLGIAAKPWKQRTQARGMEFSTTPLPVPRREAFFSGRLFDEPTMTCIPALGSKTVRYVALLSRVPHDFGDVREIELSPGQIKIRGSQSAGVVSLSAADLRSLLTR